MAPGSQIKVSNSMYIKFESSVVTAACDEMWKGIELDDYASITLVTGSEISDAQYAIKFLKGGFLTITAGGATLKRNYISLYAPDISTNTPPNNTRNISIPFFEQAIFDGSSNTINEYMGQTPSVINNKSLAGIVLNDVNNFSIPFVSNPLLGNQFNDLNSGIALFRSNSTIHSCNFNDIHKINGYSFPYSGNAIYCNSDKNNICSIQIGALQNNLIDNTFTKCDKGVVCSNNINMVVEGNHFNEVSEEAILSVANPLMNIQITNNKIEKVNMGIKVLSSPNALLNISNNTISSIHPYYSGNFGSTGIIVMNKSTNAMRGSISSNIIGLSRIGIYLSLLDKDATAPKLNITNNNLYFHLPPTQIGSDVHYAIWSNGCNNLNISDNSLDRMYPISLGLSQAMYGLYIRQGKNLDLTRNSISRFGTAMRFQDNCSNTKLQCNNMIACEQGVFLNDATTILTTQGNPSTMEAWDNKWTAFGLNNNRTACSIVNPPIGVIWYHQGTSQPGSSNYTIFSPFPSADNFIIPYQNSFAGPCSNNQFTNDETAMQNHVTEVVDEDVNYNPASFNEDKYKDQVAAFEYLYDNPEFRNTDSLLLAFYNQTQADNIGVFNSVDKLNLSGEYINAISVLNGISVENLMEQYQKYTLGLALNFALNSDYQLTQADSVELLNIAYTPLNIGGIGVLNARALLGLEVDIQSTGYRLMNPESQPTSVASSVESAQDNVIKTLVFDSKGCLVLEGISFTNTEYRNFLSEGVYTIKIIKTNSTNIRKISIIK